MSLLPVIAFSAWSGTGKTTIIEQLIKQLKCRGLRVAAIKHDAHDFEIDREGKDSWRFSHAGADITVIQSLKKTALIEQRSLDLTDTINMIHDVDIILAEGYNDLIADSACSYRLFRIGISRSATDQGLRTPASECIAVMTDDPSLTVPAGTQIFALNDITGLADFLTNHLQLPVT